MVLEDFLFPQEVIKYQSKKEMKFGGCDYVLYITNRRIIGHKRKGLIRKKDRVLSLALEDLREIKYDEQGLIRKTGVLIIETPTQNVQFIGKTDDVKVVWREIQQYLQSTEGVGAPTAYSRPQTTTDASNMVVTENPKPDEETINIVKIRFAKGEITEEEFQKTKALLES